jgi:hypothetical protein
VTTIIYANGVLAGDTLQVSQGTRVGRRVKVGKAKDGSLVASAGNASYGIKLQRWATEDGYGEPPLPPNEDSMGLYISNTGLIAHIEDEGLAFTDTEVIAIGSGRDIALGAVAAGASAIEAVRIASTLDVSTGTEVVSVRLGDDK